MAHQMILKRFFSSTPSKFGINKVTIIGSGLMGSGIAQVTAHHGGMKVHLVDNNEKALEKAKESIGKSITKIVTKELNNDPKAGGEKAKSIMSNINFTLDLNSSVSDSDLVIEAIVENLDIKKKLFSSIDKVAGANCIFSSNTSSLEIGLISSTCSADRRKNFGGLHFFSPVPLMKLLEVVKTDETSSETFGSLNDFGRRINKATVACKDTPGFIVNRLLIPYMLEAVKMLERGDASARDIDTGMKLGAGYPMGPFELADFVGLDVLSFIMEGWEKKFPSDPNFQTPKLLKKLVAEGKLGRKSGQGFYEYKK